MFPVRKWIFIKIILNLPFLQKTDFTSLLKWAVHPLNKSLTIKVFVLKRRNFT